MTRIKICGIRSYENALMVAQAGADMIGFNFYTETPRYVDPNTARDIVDRLHQTLGDHCPLIIGLFVNATSSHINKIARLVGLDAVQLSGDESLDLLHKLDCVVFKSIRPQNLAAAMENVEDFAPTFPVDKRLPSVIVDAYHPKLYGGTGETASVGVALAVKEQVPRMMLAGGLNPDNVTERIRSIQPWGVDVASGVEDGTPGIKDETKVKVFVSAVKGVNA